jgi:hypothetical protein
VEAPPKGSMRGPGSRTWQVGSFGPLDDVCQGRSRCSCGCIYEPWISRSARLERDRSRVYGLAKLQSGSSGPSLPALGQTAELDPDGCRQTRQRREWRRLAFTEHPKVPASSVLLVSRVDSGPIASYQWARLPDGRCKAASQCSPHPRCPAMALFHLVPMGHTFCNPPSAMPGNSQDQHLAQACSHCSADMSCRPIQPTSHAGKALPLWLDVTAQCTSPCATAPVSRQP